VWALWLLVAPGCLQDLSSYPRANGADPRHCGAANPDCQRDLGENAATCPEDCAQDDWDRAYTLEGHAVDALHAGLLQAAPYAWLTPAPSADDPPDLVFAPLDRSTTSACAALPGAPAYRFEAPEDLGTVTVAGTVAVDEEVVTAAGAVDAAGASQSGLVWKIDGTGDPFRETTHVLWGTGFSVQPVDAAMVGTRPFVLTAVESETYGGFLAVPVRNGGASQDITLDRVLANSRFRVLSRLDTARIVARRILAWPSRHGEAVIAGDMRRSPVGAQGLFVARLVETTGMENDVALLGGADDLQLVDVVMDEPDAAYLLAHEAVAGRQRVVAMRAHLELTPDWRVTLDWSAEISVDASSLTADPLRGVALLRADDDTLRVVARAGATLVWGMLRRSDGLAVGEASATRGALEVDQALTGDEGRLWLFGRGEAGVEVAVTASAEASNPANPGFPECGIETTRLPFEARYLTPPSVSVEQPGAIGTRVLDEGSTIWSLSTHPTRITSEYGCPTP